MAIINKYAERKFKSFVQSMNLLLPKSIGVRVAISHEKRFVSGELLSHLVNIHFVPVDSVVGAHCIVTPIHVYPEMFIEDREADDHRYGVYLRRMVRNAYCLFWFREILRKLEARGLLRVSEVLMIRDTYHDACNVPGFRIDFLRYNLGPVYAHIPFYSDNMLIFVRYEEEPEGGLLFPYPIKHFLCSTHVRVYDTWCWLSSFEIQWENVEMEYGESVFGFPIAAVCAATYGFLGELLGEGADQRAYSYQAIREIAEDLTGIRVPADSYASVRKIRNAIRNYEDMCDSYR